jgi:hypothetical protein
MSRAGSAPVGERTGASRGQIASGRGSNDEEERLRDRDTAEKRRLRDHEAAEERRRRDHEQAEQERRRNSTG